MAFANHANQKLSESQTWFRIRQPALRYQRWRSSAKALLLAAAVIHFGYISSVDAQDTPETRAFRTAANAFQDGLYEIAQREFTMFVAAYPQSPMLPEAILLQARSALQRSNAVTAINLLSTNLVRAGPLAELYRYYLGTALLAASNYQAAAKSFAKITADAPDSVLLLEASYGEAQARFQLREFSGVTTLLGNTNGNFQRAARRRPNDVLTIRGKLLLAESLLEKKKFREAEQVTRQLAESNLSPEYLWDRQQLLCRILVADNRALEALVQSTNLVQAAVATTRPKLLADSVAFQAGILEQLDRFDEAGRAYTNNLAETAPIESRKRALLRIIEIKISQDRSAEAAQVLEEFLARYPDDRGSDVSLLTLGELQLKDFFSSQTTNASSGLSGNTNRLQQALAHFDRLLATYTNSPLSGKALLQKGWGLWLAGSFADSALAFEAAAEALPASEDQAIARFKLADAQLAQGDYTNALRNYRILTNDFFGETRVRDELFPHAIFQIVRASLESGDAIGAASAMRQLLDAGSDGFFTEQSLFVVGQSFLKARQPAEARRLFEEFLRRFPDQPLAPRVELSLARTYLQEGKWGEAIDRYERWIDRFPTNELRARAEFNRGLAYFRSGDDTNAFLVFTNLVHRFPSHELAPLAQYWIGDYFHRHGQYGDAQRAFQIIPENTAWPLTNLTYRARFMAGCSAFAGQLWKDAEDHFTKLVNDRNCPDEIVAEAFFALGDTFIKEDAAPGKPLQKFADARTAFAKIPTLFATNHLAQRLVPLAWGRMGDCCLQLASQDPKQYESATNAYTQAMASSDVSTRSLAEFGLATALELQAATRPPGESSELLKSAFEHYYNILIGQNLLDKEQPDPVWVEKAGVAAARLAEEQKQWRVAMKIYERLQNVLPPLRSHFREKIEKANELLRAEKDSTGD
jgi:TolA-binding protein